MQDYQTALGVLQQHWDTWITENDFIAMAAAGLTHIRSVHSFPPSLT